MLKSLNILRLVLMMMIFVHHLGLYFGGGSLAVSAFLMLSGFCLTLGYRDRVLRDDFKYADYIKKRIVKFYPLHWLCLIAFFALGILLTENFKMPLRPLLANILLVQSWLPDYNFFFSYNAVSWYLCDALFLTLLFPVILPLIERQNVKQKISALIFMAFLYVCMVVFIPGGQLRMALLYINPLTRCFDFAIGIYVAYLYGYIREQKPERIMRIVNRGGVFARGGIAGDCNCCKHSEQTRYDSNWVLATSGCYAAGTCSIGDV